MSVRTCIDSDNRRFPIWFTLLFLCSSPIIGQGEIEFPEFYRQTGIILDSAEVKRFFEDYCDDVFVPTQAQLYQAESILIGFLWCDKDIRKHYNRQYGGIIHRDDEWIVINLINRKTKRLKSTFDGWKETLQVGFGRVYEENSLLFLVSIDDNSVKYY